MATNESALLRLSIAFSGPITRIAALLAIGCRATAVNAGLEPFRDCRVIVSRLAKHFAKLRFRRDIDRVVNWFEKVAHFVTL